MPTALPPLPDGFRLGSGDLHCLVRAATIRSAPKHDLLHWPLRQHATFDFCAGSDAVLGTAPTPATRRVCANTGGSAMTLRFLIRPGSTRSLPGGMGPGLLAQSAGSPGYPRPDRQCHGPDRTNDPLILCPRLTPAQSPPAPCCAQMAHTMPPALDAHSATGHRQTGNPGSPVHTRP
jgi:hypothetical protein